jgi:hypothetical protein
LKVNESIFKPNYSVYLCSVSQSEALIRNSSDRLILIVKINETEIANRASLRCTKLKVLMFKLNWIKYLTLFESAVHLVHKISLNIRLVVDIIINSIIYTNKLYIIHIYFITKSHYIYRIYLQKKCVSTDVASTAF